MGEFMFTLFCWQGLILFDSRAASATSSRTSAQPNGARRPGLSSYAGIYTTRRPKVSVFHPLTLLEATDTSWLDRFTTVS